MRGEIQKRRSVGLWLMACALMVFVMALVGAITRLTGSGLSMAEWRPLMGALPPMDEAEWGRVFNLYKQTPEFDQVNFDMDLAGFKKIFFWEWFHRLLGRAIGVVYALPFFWFLLRKKIPKLMLPSFVLPLVLGAVQGLMGWYMVQSGLVDDPAVSQYRLAAHLGLALFIYAVLVHLALYMLVRPDEDAAALAPLFSHTSTALVLLVLTIVWGAFVAGLDAGLVYNEFPMMGVYPWPQEIFDLTPWWKNFFENHGAVQFMHRCLALLTALSMLSLAWRSRYFHTQGKVGYLFGALAFMVVLQFILGVATLLSGVSVMLAVAHQGGAMVLITILVWLLYELPYGDISADLRMKD